MTMGDQKFVCGRHKNHTFQYVAENDREFCEAVLRTKDCNKYCPKEFQLYLLSLGRPTLSERTVMGFVDKWDKHMEAEFQNIVGTPKIETKEVHPPASNHTNGNLGVFIRYFVKKCIFNVQNADASSSWIETFARIFPFRVSKTVPPAKLEVRELLDAEFYSTLAAFMVRHFEDKCDLADDIVDLFLLNVYHFKQEHFNESAMRKLKSVVDSATNADKRAFAPAHVNEYLKRFPRLSQAGAVRYAHLRQAYNSLCAAFGREGLGNETRNLRKLPEINCYELLQLLEPNFFASERAEYTNRFLKYLFFFVYAIERGDDHPIFFVDDPLYECLKDYTEYKSSREPPENLKLCLWMVTLIHRRTQPFCSKNGELNFEMDDEHLQHIRQYVENFPGVKSAVVGYELPTSLLHLNIPVVTEDTIFNVCYRNAEKSKCSDFYKGIIKALMCPFIVTKVVTYNPYIGKETSLEVPQVKKEVLEFVRRHNRYDPAISIPVECAFTENLEIFFEESTIQWDEKYPKKENSLPVHDYEEIFGGA